MRQKNLDVLQKLLLFCQNENINQVDLDDKLEYIKQLFSDNYKDELQQLCLFLKNEIENRNLDLCEDQYDVLSKIVTKYLDMLGNNTLNINYKDEINNLNMICENIIMKK